MTTTKRFPMSARVLQGLQTANNATDLVNDIDFAAGYACDDTGEVYQLTTALTKQLDAAFAAGNNAGGLFTGTKAANTTYHFWLIRNNTTGAVDAGFDTSVTGANVPAGWTKICRVMSMKTIVASATWMRYFQRGDDITVQSAGNSLGSNQALTLTNIVGLPAGLELRARFNASYIINSGASTSNNIQHAPGFDTTGLSVTTEQAYSGTAAVGSAINFTEISNTNAQIYLAANISASIAVYCLGWWDRRGKEN